MEITQRRFNAFDWIFIILVIIAVGAGAYYLRSNSSSKEDTIRYTVQVQMIRNDIAEQLTALSASAQQQDVIDSVKNYTIGKVVSVNVEQAKSVVTNSVTGVISEVPFPDFSQVTLTIEAQAALSNGIYLINGYKLNVGTPVYFRLPYLCSSGYCKSLEVIQSGSGAERSQTQTQLQTDLQQTSVTQ